MISVSCPTAAKASLVLEITGYAAAVLTTCSFIPQVIKTIKTRETKGLSLLMYAAFVTGVFCWVLYGVFRRDIPLLAANITTFVLAFVVLCFKIVNTVKGIDRAD